MATEVVLPMLGITVENGKIVEWLKREGDSVEKGEIIFVVETDKVATEVESPASGILAKVFIQPGLEVPILTVVGIITEPGEKVPEEYTAYIPEESAVITEQARASELDVVTQTGQAVYKTRTGPLGVMPAGRKLARDKGLDLTSVVGTGPDGVILLRDVEAAVGATEVKASTIARRLAQKKGMALDGIKGTGVRGRVMTADVERAAAEALAPEFGKTLSMDSIRKIIARP